jgi:hypothetical protein
MKKAALWILNFIIIFYLLSSISCTEKKNARDIYRESIKKFNLANNHKVSVFIDENYVFNNEGLNKPTFIRYNYATDEVVIFDKGNMCFYIFDKNGKYVRKFGKVGQGPGEYMSVSALEIDKDGIIYILDIDNQRITYYSSSGEYIHTFHFDKIISPNRPTPFRLVINESGLNKEILLNNPYTEYYISVYSLKGELIKQIGKIQDFKSNFSNNHPETNYVFAVGYPFVDNHGNYCILLEMLFDVRKYDSKGMFLEEKDLDIILGTDKKKRLINPRKEVFTYQVIMTPVRDFAINEGRINILFFTFSQDGHTMIQYLDYDLNILDRYEIYIPKDVIEKRPAFYYFEPILNDDIYMGSSATSLIYKYQKKK